MGGDRITENWCEAEAALVNPFVNLICLEFPVSGQGRLHDFLIRAEQRGKSVAIISTLLTWISPEQVFDMVSVEPDSSLPLILGVRGGNLRLTSLARECLHQWARKTGARVVFGFSEHMINNPPRQVH